MDLFNDLKIKEYLSKEHEWKYSSGDMFIYYHVDEDHIITMTLLKNVYEPNILLALFKYLFKKEIFISLRKVSPSINNSDYLNISYDIVSKIMYKFSSDYFCVKNLIKIQRSLVRLYLEKSKKEQTEINKILQKQIYERGWDKAPYCMKRDITIDKILE